ncbi:MAG: Stk1 family PASTA domain-containing Ser/Thr kinase [Clostridia bacterium]|nr:Stk1 family PASTA domain-containing Ser/Thr kinase [Clostridia bacterium]
MESIAAGTILNQRFEIIECVGIGGMSEVYKALDIENGDYYALKVLKPEYSTEAEFIKRFKNEAEAASKLDHANIVSIYGIGQDGNIHYIIMEYVEGVTLKDYIEAYQSISWQDALKISAQILLAMDHAHSKHIIHRDIKPHNVMMGKDGSVKLADFGIARAATGSTITASDDAGSVHYLSPEQARGGYVDERSDIYSLGISLFEMLIGVVPFDGDSNVSVALKHIDGKIVPPHEIDIDIPVGVSDLVVIATRKDPGMRFQSARDMISKIRKVIENPNESLIESYIDDPEAVVAEVLSESSAVIKNKENLNKDISTSHLSEEENHEADMFDDSFDEDEEDEKNGENDDSERKSVRVRRAIALVLTYIAASLCTVLVILWVISCYNKSTSSLNNMFDQKPYIMMDFTGHDYDLVVATLQEKGIIPVEKTEYTDELPPGVVISQSVDSGAEVFSGKEITFTVSCPTDSFELTSELINQTKSFEEVQQKLIENGAVVESYNVLSTTVQPGCVVRTEPDIGSYIKKGQTVYLYVCAEKMNNQIVVPDFTGLSTSEVYEKAGAAGIENITIHIKEGADVTDIVEKIKDAKEALNPPSATPTLSPSSDPAVVPTSDPDIGDDSYADPSESASLETAPTENDLLETAPSESVSSETPSSEEETAESFIPGDNSAVQETESNSLSSNDVPYDAALLTESATDEIIEPVKASDTVVSQFPPANTYIYEGESIDLYFYDMNELIYLENIDIDSHGVLTAEIRESKTVELKYPTDIVNSGNVDYIYIKYTLETGVEIEEELINQSYSDFPKKINVPFAYGSSVTMIDVYILNKNDLYKRIYVYD